MEERGSEEWNGGRGPGNAMWGGGEWLLTICRGDIFVFICSQTYKHKPTMN